MKQILIIGLTFLFFGCDPGLSGDAKVFNDSNATLTIRYTEYKNHVTDTITKDIQPGEAIIIQVFGGLGDKSKFDCCPYDRIVSIKSPSGPIQKLSIQCDSWNIPNKKKLKRYGKEPIKCEFHITQADL